MEIPKNEIKEILELIKKLYKYDYTGYSLPVIVRRIDNLIHKNGIKNLVQLKFKLVNDPSFINEVVSTFSISVTEMFRDPHFFNCLKEQIFPKLEAFPLINIWHAGCATGEEVYSLAIMLKEYGLYDRCSILATDINQNALNSAKKGHISKKNFLLAKDNYLKSGGKIHFESYFDLHSDGYKIKDELLTNVMFFKHNLFSDASPNEFNLILCRNVLIYFSREAQNTIVELFSKSLKPFGYLGLGPKESLLFVSVKKQFKSVVSSEKLYQYNPTTL